MAYTSHIQTTILQKLLLTVGSGGMSILNPARGDMIATFGEMTAGLALPAIKRKMLETREGEEILMEQPRITNASVNIVALRSLPDKTLGREYARFLDKLRTSPDARPSVQFVDDLDLVYVMQRYRETHDLYHTVLEMPTNMLGEVTVKWWEGLQLGLPMCLLGGLFGAARLYPKQRVKYVEEYLPWVLRSAPKANFFMSVYWERYWELPLKDLRDLLEVEEPPTASQ